MPRRKCSRYSGIGGQAVLEGIMMKNKEKYAVAVRKPDGTIEVELENYQGLFHGSKIIQLPFIRGIFNFIDSLVLGTKCLNYSASFYDEAVEEEKIEQGKAKKDPVLSRGKGRKADQCPGGDPFRDPGSGDFYRAALFCNVFAGGLYPQSFPDADPGRHTAYPDLCALCLGHQRHGGYQEIVSIPWSGA